MPIPDSTLPGHRALHDRTIGALQLCQESIGVEFKSSAPWENLKIKITKNVLAMGNLRDGGLLVIGVTQNQANWQLSGIGQEHIATYEPDDMQAFVGRYVSPTFRLDVVRVLHEGTPFLAIATSEFAETPLVCRRNGPDGPAGEGLIAGGLYVRLANPPQTTRITDAAQMHDLLDLAAEKRARRMLELRRRVGDHQEGLENQLNQELGDL